MKMHEIEAIVEMALHAEKHVPLKYIAVLHETVQKSLEKADYRAWQQYSTLPEHAYRQLFSLKTRTKVKK